MKGKLRKILCLIFAIALLGSLMAGCGGDSKETPAPSASADAPKDSATTDDGKEDDKDASGAAGGLENGITPREETLYMGGLMWGPPANFNPMSSTGVFPTNSGDGSKILIYEPLFMYNLMATDNGTNGLEPLLGTEFSWEGNDLIVKLNPAAKFSDGEAFTAEDAAFSFQLGSDYSIPWSSAADIFDKVEAKDDHTLVLTMIEGGNKLMAIRQLGRVPMMPKHIWEPLTQEMEEAEIRAYENFDPIGTGPYTVLYYDDTRIVCLRNDEYWGQDASMFGKLPAPKYITVLRWNDNAGINTAFANGELDITESFLPQVWQLWEDGAPVKTYLNDSPYHVPAVLVTLVFNLEKPGLNNPDVRRAIAYAINYPRISELAMSGYSQDIVPSLMLPQEMEQ